MTRTAHLPEDGFRWGEFLRRPMIETDPLIARRANCGKRILLTGTGGSIGSALAMAILALNGDETWMGAIRLGNALGSQGSVVPLFLVEMQRCEPVTVTRPEVQCHIVSEYNPSEALLEPVSSTV